MAFDNDFYAPPQDRNLFVDSVTIDCEAPGSTCTASDAVDLGSPGTDVTVEAGGCARVQDAYPSWWGTRVMRLENTSPGTYPVPFTWTNTCSGSGGSGTFTADWQGQFLDVTSASCPTVIDLLGSTSGGITLRYWAN